MQSISGFETEQAPLTTDPSRSRMIAFHTLRRWRCTWVAVFISSVISSELELISFRYALCSSSMLYGSKLRTNRREKWTNNFHRFLCYDQMLKKGTEAGNKARYKRRDFPHHAKQLSLQNAMRILTQGCFPVPNFRQRLFLEKKNCGLLSTFC